MFAAFVAFSGSARAQEIPRVAWAGLDRGALSPADAEVLEQLVLEQLAASDDLHLLDAAGHPLGKKALGREANRAQRMVEDGVDHLLRGHHETALEKLDRAIALFESNLTKLNDHDLLHDALLARAEAQADSGQKEAAKTTLKRLAALAPKRVPTAKTHRPAFISLWKEAKKSLGRPSRVEIDADREGASILIDGKPLGPAPAAKTQVPAGSHYVVAEWPGFIVPETVQVGAGTVKNVRLKRDGPAERARSAVIDEAAAKRGLAPLAETITKLGTIAASDGVIVAVVRKTEGATSLYLIRHDAKGLILAAAGAPLPIAVQDPAAARAVADLAGSIVKNGPAVWFAAAGKPSPAPSALEVCYGARGATPASIVNPGAVTAVAPVRPDSERAVPKDDGNLFAAPPAAASSSEDDDLTSEWWFWALIAAGLAGGAAGGYFLLRPDPTTTTLDVVLPSR